MKRSSVCLLVFAALAALLFAFIGSWGTSGAGEALGRTGASLASDGGPAGVLPGVQRESASDTAIGDATEQSAPLARVTVGPPGAASESERKLAQRSFELRVSSTFISPVPELGGLGNETPEQIGLGNVAFELRRRGAAPSETPLFVGSTDANGELSVPLDWASFQLPGVGERPNFMGRVTADGYQKHLVRPEVRESQNGELRLNLLLIPGATFRGRVTNAAGRGVEAKVTLFAPSSELSGGKRPVLATASQLGAGRFELHLARDTVGDLFASAPDIGTASLLDLHLDVARPQQDLNLGLEGSGLIRGRLLDTSGVPVAGHFVQAKLDELETGTLNSSELFGFEAQLMLQGSGFRKARSATDEDGWFMMQGLRNARYVLRTSLKAVDYRYALLLTEEPVMANGALLILTLPDAAQPGPKPAAKESKDVRSVLVSVRITGVPNAADREALEVMNARIRSGRARKRPELPAGTVFLRHTDEQNRPVRLKRAPGDAVAGSSRIGTRSEMSVLGETRMYAITGSGKHELTARMPGGRMKTFSVDLDLGPASVSIHLGF